MRKIWKNCCDAGFIIIHAAHTARHWQRVSQYSMISNVIIPFRNRSSGYFVINRCELEWAVAFSAAASVVTILQRAVSRHFICCHSIGFVVGKRDLETLRLSYLKGITSLSACSMIPFLGFLSCSRNESSLSACSMIPFLGFLSCSRK